MTEAPLMFSGVGHAYVPGRWVFRDYTASIPSGHIFAVLGPNGSGKSTLLKILLGVLKPTEGSVTLPGPCAFVPQLFQVAFDYSVLDMVLMGRARQIHLLSQPSRRDREISLRALDRLGMADFAYRPFHELSGDERQMVMLARAIAADASLLLLDEPTSALDLKNQIAILDLLWRLSHEHGLTVVFTTHHPHHALAIADESLLMPEHRKFVFGASQEVLTEANLRTLYGVDLKRIEFAYRDRTVQTLVPVITAGDTK